jgi:nucleoside-diphosphate-sugar epimerase
MQSILVTGSTCKLAQTFMSQHKGKYSFVTASRSTDSDILWDIGKNKLECEKDVDVVIHYASTGNQLSIPEAFAINSQGTLELLGWAKNHNVKKFVYISTGSVYEGGDKITENSSLSSNSKYALTKNIAEELCQFYSSDFQVVILRLFHPYGPGTQSSKIIDLFIESIQNGKEIKLNNGGKPFLSPIYIDDLNEAIVSILDKEKGPFSIYNIGGNEMFTVGEIARKISSLLGKSVVSVDTNQDAIDIAADNSKLRTIFTPKVSLEEGLRRTIKSKNYA